jgi:hypothetical protein
VSDHAVIDRDLETMHVFTAVDINAKHQAPSTKHQAPSTKHQAPSTQTPSSFFGRLVSPFAHEFIW